VTLPWRLTPKRSGLLPETASAARTQHITQL
jgi:hypothetical protein